MSFVVVLASIFVNADLPPEIAATEDFAHVSRRDAWLRHPVYGEASFDAFVRAPNNPAHRGSPPYEWPVNGSLFEDPVSGHWFLYVGHYLAGYRFEPGQPSHCTVFRSKDRGATWDHLGPVFGETPHVFEGESSPVDHAPDATVLYADGRYHMCFDWTTANTTWENAANPPPDANSGVGYAWADRPEGPFQIAARPIATTREQEPLLGKYRRLYASTLVRRANDWLVLTLTDSGPYFGWALLGMTAAAPEGPYTKPAILLHPESQGYHPPLLEFFPAFVHDGFIHAPAASVALNRNYQGLFRVPIEDAMRPEAWELADAGSVWHAEPVENEHYGIWGQTFSGFVASDGIFHVMFPSRDESGLGTINLASRPWNKPFRDRGFVVSGHEGASLAILRRGGPVRRLKSVLEVRGAAMIIWDAGMPLGPNRPTSNATLHPLMLSQFTGLDLSEKAWALVRYDAHGKWEEMARGEVAPRAKRRVEIRWQGNDALLKIDGDRVFSGELPQGPGAFGIFAATHSHVRVEQFLLTGAAAKPRLTYLYTEGLLGAAQSKTDWEEVTDPRFRYGIGVVSAGPGARAKWNFEGTLAALYAPRGPEYGAATVFLDGAPAAIVSFHADAPLPSQPVFFRTGLDEGRHALAVEPVAGGTALQW
ncbi:MAG TPA: hypothetical protein PKI11_20520, partial [Candidatus Hydrogenedentes bacterium]|nr:hypothetical protein [Candidatus Hydrogenedentota bacterium]